MPAEFRGLKPLDREGVLDRVEGDMDLYRELFQIFEQEYLQYLDSVTAAVATADADKLMRSAHAFKSCLGNLGAARCHAIAGSLERAGRIKEISSAKDELELLRQELAVFVAEARQFAA